MIVRISDACFDTCASTVLFTLQCAENIFARHFGPVCYSFFHSSHSDSKASARSERASRKKRGKTPEKNNCTEANKKNSSSGKDVKVKDEPAPEVKSEPLASGGLGQGLPMAASKDGRRTPPHARDMDADESYVHIMCNNHWYLFLRLHAILCERLTKMYTQAVIIASEEARDRRDRKESTAVALKLKPKSKYS